MTRERIQTSLVDQCVRCSLPIWEQCLQTEFLRRLADGTLDEACFRGYIVDDSLYLREYARVFAWGMTRAETMEEMRFYTSVLSFVNEKEDATRLVYLKGWGLSDAELQFLPQRPENRAYTEHMIRAVQSGGAPECMMAVLPCMLSYCWIFRAIVDAAPAVLEGRFAPLVRDYTAPYCDAVCKDWMDRTDRLCGDLPPRRKESCMEIFRESSLHELRFWQMSARPREDV